MRRFKLQRTVLFFSCYCAVALLGSGCDDGGDGDSDTQADSNGETTASGDGDGDGSCNDSPYGEQSECVEYITCAETNCQTAYETCFGADYLNGNFAGTCADYMSCNNACDCGDTACTTDCYNMHAAMGTPCGDCLVNDVGTCVATSCLAELQSCA